MSPISKSNTVHRKSTCASRNAPVMLFPTTIAAAQHKARQLFTEGSWPKLLHKFLLEWCLQLGILWDNRVDITAEQK